MSIDYRAAHAIFAILKQRRPIELELQPISDQLNVCNQLLSRLDKAIKRGWVAAERDARGRLRSALQTLTHRTNRVSDHLFSRSDCDLVPSAENIFRELQALREEFAHVDIDVRNQRLCVHTSEVELEGVDLGRFEIRLNWQYILESVPFDIISLDDAWDGGDGITHPHVQNERLCEGEGASMIRRALTEGRLLDFCQLIDRVLRTYNPDSAYADLDVADRVECYECGDRISEDDALFCSRCERDLCRECSSLCERCNDRVCDSCLWTCSQCQEASCQSCLKSCDGCGQLFCNSCLSGDLCDDCFNDQEIESEGEVQSDEPSEVDATTSSIHALRDVQADFSA